MNQYSADGTGSASAAISSAAQVGASTGAALYYSETKYWKNGSNPPVYGTPGNYSSADLAYADSYTTNYYAWLDTMVQSQVNLTNRDGSSSSVYAYDSSLLKSCAPSLRQKQRRPSRTPKIRCQRQGRSEVLT